jgi:exoribonuclease R
VAAVREKVERGELVQGSLRVNAKNPSEAFVSVQGYSRDVAIVGPQNRGRALEGDVVAVALLPREPGGGAGERGACGSGDVQYKGRVVSVVQAMHRLIHIGHLRACSSAASPAQPGLEFVSHDGRYPAFEVRADECSGEVLQHIHGAGAHMLLSARITGWPAGAAGPRAQVLDVVGPAGDIAAETNALLLEHDIDATGFPEEVLADLPATKFESIVAEQLPLRRDFRAQRVYTIDPATARYLLFLKINPKTADKGLRESLKRKPYTLHQGPGRQCYPSSRALMAA